MRRLANALIYGLARAVLWGLACLPMRLASWLGARLGDALYLALPSRRRVTLDNLALAFGQEKTAQERQHIARATFQSLGQHLMDFSHLGQMTATRFRQVCLVEGLEHLETLVQRGKGVLILSAHFGSWELSPAVALCVSTPFHIIVRPLDHPALQRLAALYRQRCGYHAIARRTALPDCIAALRRGEVVAALMDQSSLRRESVVVEFFGTNAYTARGPALLALRTGCAVISGFITRVGPGQHRLTLSPEIAVQRSGNVPQDILENTRRFTQVIEAQVRRHPEQWFWLHRRWKQRP